MGLLKIFNKKKYNIRVINEEWSILMEYKSNIQPSIHELILIGDPNEYYEILNIIHNSVGNDFITLIVKKSKLSLIGK